MTSHDATSGCWTFGKSKHQCFIFWKFPWISSFHPDLRYMSYTFLRKFNFNYHIQIKQKSPMQAFWIHTESRLLVPHPPFPYRFFFHVRIQKLSQISRTSPLQSGEFTPMLRTNRTSCRCIASASAVSYRWHGPKRSTLDPRAYSYCICMGRDAWTKFIVSS